jgi:hypothetical protein
VSNKRKPRPTRPSAAPVARPGGRWRHSVVLTYVHPTELSAYFMKSCDDLRTYDLRHGQHLAGRQSQVSSANISNARNNLTRQFLDETDAAWMWMVDADMVFPPETLELLLENADPVKAPIVGGLCFGIADGLLFPTLYDLRPKDGGGHQMWRYDVWPENAMFQVAATGAACLLIHRSVLEAVRARGFNQTYPWWQETELGGYPCGEDMTFCLRAGMLGFPIHVDTGVPIGHHKSMVLDADMYRRQRAHQSPAPGPSQPGAGNLQGGAA